MHHHCQVEPRRDQPEFKQLAALAESTMERERMEAKERLGLNQ